MQVLVSISNALYGYTLKAGMAMIAFLIFIALIALWSINACSGVEFWQVSHNACIEKNLDERMVLVVMCAYAAIASFVFAAASFVLHLVALAVVQLIKILSGNKQA